MIRALVLLSLLGMGLECALVAVQKDRPLWAGFGLGMVLGPLGWWAVLRLSLNPRPMVVISPTPSKRDLGTIDCEDPHVLDEILPR